MRAICDYIIKEQSYCLKNKATVRQTAKVFKVSKSTVHKDMTERLPSLEKESAGNK